MKIVTVLKSGGEFHPNDVQILKQQIDQNNNDVDFVCLTDFEMEEIETIPLQHDLPKWWSKLEIFNSNNFDENETLLYIDLDTLIVNNIEHFEKFQGNFDILRDPYRGRKEQKAFGSGIMLFRNGQYDYILNDFLENKEKIMENFRKGGDQRYIEMKLNINEINYLQDEFPEQLFSYKADLCTDNGANGGKKFKGIPETTRIIFFHGKPRPKEVDYLNIV